VGILLKDVPEFQAMLREVIKSQRQDNQAFLQKGPEETHAMEVFTRGLLQGSHNVLETLVELSKIDLLDQEVKEDVTENTELDGHDAGSGHY
jgi:hypothetical protein